MLGLDGLWTGQKTFASALGALSSGLACGLALRSSASEGRMKNAEALGGVGIQHGWTETRN